MSHLKHYMSFWRKYFYRSNDPTNSVRALKDGHCDPDSSQSRQVHSDNRLCPPCHHAIEKFCMDCCCENATTGLLRFTWSWSRV